MALDSVITSPHRRSQPAQNAFTPPSFNRQISRNELGNSMTLLQRHRFLLTALVLLTILCTVYLYFAVTFGSGDSSSSCIGLTGARKASCLMKLAKEALGKGKSKYL